MNEKATILVADDDPDLLSITATLLSSNGYEVMQASTAQACIEAARAHQPDLVLLDVVFGDASGIDLCKQIKSDPRLQGIFVVLLSGSRISSDDQAEGLDIGADGYIARPVSNKELLARVHSMVRIKQAEDKVRRVSEEWETTFNSITDLVSIHDKDFKVVKVNRAFRETLGMGPDGPIRKKCFELIHGSDEPWPVCPHRRAMETRKAQTEEFWEPRLGRYLLVSCSPLINDVGDVIGSAHTAKDITKRKRAEEALQQAHDELEQRVAERTADLMRANEQLAMEIEERKRAEKHLHKDAERDAILLELYEKASRLSDKELYDYALDQAVRLTDSAIGFFHLVSDDQKNVVLTTWNREARKNCTAPHDTHYAVDQAGNWVDCVRIKGPVVYNDYPTSSNRKGLPDGHAPVHRFMSIPVVEEDSVRFIFGVGNKAVDYENQDVIQIQLVANELNKILEQRRSEEALRQSEAALRASQDDLRRLTGKLLSAEEEERRHVARELHDDFTQRLAALAIEAGKLERELGALGGNVHKKIATFREQMVHLSGDVHRLSRRLHPTILDDLGLVKAIEAECVRFSQQEGIEVTFIARNVSDSLPKDAALSLYRVVQESLRNVVKHGRTKEARVSLVGGRDMLRLAVEDDGAGFDARLFKKREGLGLASMEERMRLVNGRFSIESERGRGTVVRAEVRVKRSEP